MPSIALVGAGPRGASVIERLAAGGEPGLGEITLHIIDDAQPGAGRVWDTDQPADLCMNTLAGAVTLFTEPGSSVGLPVVEGPTLYQWVQALRSAHVSMDSPECLPEIPECYRHEIASMHPGSNPSRAIYGLYLRWFFHRAIKSLPSCYRVVDHRARVRSIDSADVSDVLTLDDGTKIEATTTVLATGWEVPAPSAQERLLAAATNSPTPDMADKGLRWVGPGNPLDQDFAAVPAGQPAVVRGLGMGFFDAMSQLTIGRGGHFVDTADSPSGLSYHPSGSEPLLLVASHRGYPYLPKSDYGGLPPKAAHQRLGEIKPGADFATTIWPALIEDAEQAYGGSLDITALADPVGDTTGTTQEFTAHISTLLAGDIEAAAQGSGNRLKAALWSLSSARKKVTLLVDDRSDAAYRRYAAFGQMVGSGPPLFRSRQLLALVEAGLVFFLGKDPTLTIEDTAFRLDSPTTGTHRARTLIDAFMHLPDIRRPGAGPMGSLVSTKRVRPFAGSASPETDVVTRRCVQANGELDGRVHIIGIPTHAQMPDTTISPMPGTDALFLQETDAAARDVLAVVRQASSSMKP